MSGFEDPPCTSFPALFFGERFRNDDPDTIRAKLICKRCVYQDDCLDRGRREPHHIWGGTTPRDRGYDGSGRPRIPENRRPKPGSVTEAELDRAAAKLIPRLSDLADLAEAVEVIIRNAGARC